MLIADCKIEPPVNLKSNLQSELCNLQSHVTRLERLLVALERFYGLLPSPPRDPFTLWVWEVLSAHSTPAKRDLAMGALKRARALTPDAMSRAPQAKVEAAVALAGPYLEQRLGALRTGVDLFRRAPTLPAVIKGPLPGARRALKRFPQIGDADAHCMLLFAADHPVLPVDVPVHRVGLRLEYGRRDARFRKSARSVQQALARELPADVEAFRRAFVYLSHHGTATCTDLDPHCPVCPLNKDCPEGVKRIGEIADC